MASPAVVDPLNDRMRWMNRRLSEARARVLRASAPSEARAVLLNHAFRQAHRHFYSAEVLRRRLEAAGTAPPERDLLRRETFRHLLRAERSLDETEGAAVCRGESLRREGKLVLRSPDISLAIDLRRGARWTEWSDKAAGANLSDFHSPGSPRGTEVVHGLAAGTEIGDFMRGRFKTVGNFSQARMSCQMRGRRGGWLEAAFSRRVPVRFGVGPAARLDFLKTVRLKAGQREAILSWSVSGRAEADFLFGVEWTLRLKDAHVNRVGSACGVRRFSVVDPVRRVEVSWAFSRPARLWHFPVEGVWGSGGRIGRTYEGVCLIFLWPVRFSGGTSGRWRALCEVKLGSPDPRG